MQPRRPSRAPALGGAIATGLLFTLAAPPVGAWPLAFVCLLPLVAALVGRGPLARLGLGALAGVTAATLVAVPPAAVGAASFLGRPFWQGLLLTALVGQFFGGVGFASFALLAGDPGGQRPAVAVARAGAAFAAAELIRAKMFTGLPWLLLAYALAPAPQIAQLAAYGGVALISFVLAAIPAALLALATRCRRAAGAGWLGLLASAIAATWLAMPPPTQDAPDAPLQPGAVRVAGARAAPLGALRLALVQPALPMAQWGDPARAYEIVEHLVALSSGPDAQQIDVTVWPENAIQTLLPANRGLVERALENRTGRYLLLGAPRYDPSEPSRRFNAALLYRNDAEPVGMHDKVHLLPLFEYQPRILAPLALGGPELSAGERPVVLPVQRELLGPLICYEVLFPEISRSLVRDGAGVLVNLSNDAWFAGLGGAEQHFAAAVLLAIELRRPVLRSTPTGVTAAIDAAGRVVGRLAPDEPGVLVVDVHPASELSGYARAGETPAWLALIASAALTLVELARGCSRR